MATPQEVRVAAASIGWKKWRVFFMKGEQRLALMPILSRKYVFMTLHVY